MCDSSTVTDDWVTKRFHIHIGNVELRVISDHRGKVGFRPISRSRPKDEVARAMKIAYEVCLPSAEIRRRWIRATARATAYMFGIQGELQEVARGRMAEFKFLEIAIKRWQP